MLNCGTLPSTLVMLTPSIGRDSLDRLESDCGHPEMRVVGVERVGQQRIDGIVRRTGTGIGYEGKGHSDRRRVAEADQGILDHVVVVVGQIETEALARRERGGESIVPVVAYVIGQ